MRDRALGLMVHRHAVLLDRSKRRQLTQPERNELAATAAAIEELQSMEAVTKA